MKATSSKIFLHIVSLFVSQPYNDNISPPKENTAEILSTTSYHLFTESICISIVFYWYILATDTLM